jgi:hypothetical protein
LSGAIVWARTGAGVYTGTLASAFTVNKTSLRIASVQGTDFATASIERTSANVVTVRTKLGTLVSQSVAAADNILASTQVEILVYS